MQHVTVAAREISGTKVATPATNSTGERVDNELVTFARL